MPLKFAIVPVTPLQQNCSIIWCDVSHKAAVVDPGDDLDPIRRAIAKHSIDIEKILITHSHFDHAGGAAKLSRELNVPIEGPHIADQPLVEGISELAEGWGFAPVESFTPSRWLEQNDEVSVGKLTLQVHHCPGHTPGHIIFFDAEARQAFVGDVLFKGGIGRTDFPLGNHQDLIDSIKHRLWPLGDDVQFVPGHGPMSTFGDERQSNPFIGGRF